MKCPVCKEPNLALSERNGIEIDYCPECRGIWLDRGELDKILGKSGERERDHSHHSSRSSEYHQKPYKRRKSFLEELFD